HGLAPGAVEAFLQKVVHMVRAAPPAAKPLRGTDHGRLIGPVLPKLVLMVNNYCNLKCTYCYEHETVFKDKPAQMTPAVVDTALRQFYAAFAGVEEVMFIGGEATLSEDIVEYACRRAEEFARDRATDPPSFCMITNGTKMTERMFAIIDRFDMQMTFSIDGPKQIQDLVRIHHDGSGSYDRAAVNIHRYREKRAAKLGIECTLSSAQAQAGVTVSQLSQFFADEFGVSDPHIAAAGLVPGDLLNPFSG